MVAALTIPTLIQKHNNLVVETRLEKFYSLINQAITISEVDYGDKKDWYEEFAGGLDEDGNSKAMAWYNRYLAKNIVTTNIEVDEFGRPTFYLADGSAFALRSQGDFRDWVFYPGNPEKCNKKYGKEDSVGKCAFYFLYYPLNSYRADWQYHLNKGFEPYKYAWDGTEAGLYDGSYTGCKRNSVRRSYCSAIIQYNGWKIPKEYPFSVSY